MSKTEEEKMGTEPSMKAKKVATEPKASKAEKAAKPKKEKAAKVAPKKGAILKDATLYEVLRRPVVTEKSTMASEQGKIVFKVGTSESKERIREAVEQIFGVKVTKINTVLTKGKNKRFRGRLGVRSDVKKAIVTLAEGQTIDLTAGVR